MENYPIKMKIKSQRYDVEGSLFSKLLAENEDGDIDLDLSEFDPSECDSEAIELSTEGVLTLDERRVELSYEESQLTGMEGSRTSVSFEPQQEGLVTMTRDGSVSTTLVFEQGRRHHCVYNTPIMPFEVCVRTLKVENNILREGTLKLDYIIEIRGAQAERTKFELLVVDNREVSRKNENTL